MQFQEDFDDTEVELVAGSEPYISSAAAEFDIDDEAGFDDLGEVGASVANAAVGSDDDLPPGLPNARNQRQATTPAPGLSKPTEPVSYTVPDVIKNFLLYFQRNVKENNLHEIHSIYESSWSKLTDRYFKNTPWPNPAAVAQFINKDDIFLVLYKELYFRHLYTKLNPTLEQRFESWQNYCDLFNALIDASPFLSLELPNQWLWDIIDEFIYQFQSFCQFRARSENKADDIAQLKANPQIWNALTVLNYLQSLISKSNVVAILEKERSGHHVDRDHSVPALYRMLGTFSIIGLVRLHVLMGDYYLALKTLDPIDLTNKGLYTRVSACHVNLHYYLAFAYVMTRRYLDAIRTLSNILTFISRTKQYHSRTHHDQISKKNEQMYALLSVTVSLCPQRIDENIHNTLREKYGDKMIRMQRGEEAVFKEVFVFACPKFVTCSPPNYDELTPGTAQEASRVQLKLFLNEVKQQTQIPTIRSFLKLYTTIGTQKLADYLETKQEEFVMQLLCMKHKTRGATWNGGSLLNTKFAPSSDVDFYVDQNMVHIANTKISRRFGEYFIRHTLKFDNLLHNLQNLDAAKADR